MSRLLIVDHDDSFTDTIASYFVQLHVATDIIHYLDPILLDLEALDPLAIVLSPGPGHPAEVRQTLTLIQKYYRHYPILGICLGMQAIAMALGGRVIPALEVMHGKVSRIYHQDTGLFQRLPNPFHATRYHSLMVDETTLASTLVIDAWVVFQCERRIPMSITHTNYPVFGVQFHPEAILSEHGFAVLARFLELTLDNER